jgi:hypothetical protein
MAVSYVFHPSTVEYDPHFIPHDIKEAQAKRKAADLAQWIERERSYLLHYTYPVVSEWDRSRSSHYISYLPCRAQMKPFFKMHTLSECSNDFHEVSETSVCIDVCYLILRELDKVQLP